MQSTFITFLYTAVCISAPLALIKMYGGRKRATQSTSHETTPTPYEKLTHPHKYFLDILLGLVFERLIPLAKIGDYSDSNSDSENNALGKFRARIESFEYFIHAFFCLVWNWSLRRNNRDNLIVGTVTVPRKPNILHEWGITQEGNVEGGEGEISFEDEGENVEIEITCPSSVMKGHRHKFLQKGGVGMFYKKIERCPLDQFNLELSPSVPIVLWMHGGGFAVGSARDLSAKLAYEIYANQHRHDHLATKEQGMQPIILLSVNYRYAPENPFPAGVIDCLSVTEFLMEKLNSPIHIAGFSAGGNLATVTAFETMRKYPQRKIKSLVAIDPALSPKVYSLKSYQLNISSSSFCPPPFLVWCWAAYLQLGSHGDISTYRNEVEKNKILAAWLSSPSTLSTSPDKKRASAPNPMLRLICPHSSIPNEIRSPNAPRIIIKTSSACPLEDDGLHLTQRIKERGGSAVALRGRGSHGVAIVLDLKSSKEFMTQWASIIWS